MGNTGQHGPAQGLGNTMERRGWGGGLVSTISVYSILFSNIYSVCTAKVFGTIVEE